jgi:raffinose/stachyose/melibiose transport system permease protein
MADIDRGGVPVLVGAPPASTAVAPGTRRWSRGLSARRDARPGGAAARGPGEPRWLGLLYVLPAAALFTAFVILPFGDGILLSFFNWDGVSPRRWAGLANYRALYHDPTVAQAFGHAGVLIIFYAVLPLFIGLFVASSLTRVVIRGGGTVRAVLFLPQVVAPVVVGVSWRWIFDQNGPVNSLLGAIGLGSVARAWLGDFGWALPAVGVIGTWVMLGLCMVLFMGGIQKIPLSLYDAARTDGAGAFREFMLVTVPGLRNEIAIAATLTVITALRAFDLIFVTTHGGPGDATLTPSFLIYTRAFLTGQVGLAAAIATALTAVVFLVALVVSRLFEGRAD